VRTTTWSVISTGLHDMGDPVGAARHTRESLKDDGHWLLVEPFANDDVADNLNLLGRVSYAVSTLICIPASLLRRWGPGLEPRLAKPDSGR
jgi:hypothetical protein